MDIGKEVEYLVCLIILMTDKQKKFSIFNEK